MGRKINKKCTSLNRVELINQKRKENNQKTSVPNLLNKKTKQTTKWNLDMKGRDLKVSLINLSAQYAQ